MNCGLLGRKLAHSYSPQIHALLYNYPYALFELEPDQVKPFLLSNQFTGLNVTMPYKKDVLPYCDHLSEAAEKLGAVNTIIRQSDGSLLGHNTDYFGFLSTVLRTGLCVCGKKVLVLGSGGASVTAVTVLRELGAKVVTISRSGENNYDNLNKYTDASLIVNATPVGMYPDVGAAPLSLDGFANLEGVIDMIYNPARTALLQQAEKRNLIAENGLWMLISQAKESAEWFTGTTIDDSMIAKIYAQLNIQMQNIILIGMPGSGKSTIGKLLAKKMGRSFVDADNYIVENAKMSISEIFSKYGESHFRKLETQALAELGKQSSLVIATGGGCVTKEQNYSLLHQNGILIWLQRDLKALPTNGRPLSQSTDLSDMFTLREPMYQSFCDIAVNNDSTLEKTIEKILSLLDWRNQ